MRNEGAAVVTAGHVSCMHAAANPLGHPQSGRNTLCVKQASGIAAHCACPEASSTDASRRKVWLDRADGVVTRTRTHARRHACGMFRNMPVRGCMRCLVCGGGGPGSTCVSARSLALFFVPRSILQGHFSEKSDSSDLAFSCSLAQLLNTAHARGATLLVAKSAKAMTHRTESNLPSCGPACQGRRPRRETCTWQNLRHASQGLSPWCVSGRSARSRCSPQRPRHPDPCTHPL